MKSLLAANTAKDDMTFTILDVGGAEVATHTITYPGGTKPPPLRSSLRRCSRSW